MIFFFLDVFLSKTSEFFFNLKDDVNWFLVTFNFIFLMVYVKCFSYCSFCLVSCVQAPMGWSIPPFVVECGHGFNPLSAPFLMNDDCNWSLCLKIDHTNFISYNLVWSIFISQLIPKFISRIFLTTLIILTY